MSINYRQGRRSIAIASVLWAVAGCGAKSQGEQCLDSFRMSLKDPESGQVLAFEGTTLTYTATNSYGARTQGKALCRLDDGKWARDRTSESIAIMRHSTQKIDASNSCMQAGGQVGTCDGGSLVIGRSLRLGRPIDQDELRRESALDLGFE